MRTQTFFKALALSSTLSATAALAADDVVLARLTGQTQCAPPSSHYTTLGGATQEAEGKGLNVKEVRIEKLAGRMFCAACQCPDGTYYVVRAQRNDQAVKDLLADDALWEEVVVGNVGEAATRPELTSDF